MSTHLIDLVLSLAALPLGAAAGYLGFLALLARRGTPPPDAPPRRTTVVVPAHDEEAGITETIRSLLAVDYPRDCFDILVVADNCGDRTAEVARAAGAEVLVRTDTERQGKGYALRLAFDHVLGAGDARVLVVVDADTLVSENLLSVFNAHIAAGAQAVQAHYGVRNAEDSWRTRLLVLAFAVFHGVRSRARERLGLSCGLRGNGMAFTREVLAEVPHEAWSVVEDLEYGVQLGVAGHRVHYAEEAEVLGEMASSEASSRSQRRRWEGGRWAMAKTHAVPLVKRAWTTRSPMVADLALDVIVPPLTALVVWAVAGLAVCALAAALGPSPKVAPWLFGGALAALAVYVLRGWALSGTGVRGLFDLLLAPAYVCWKIILGFLPGPHQPRRWVRTERAATSGDGGVCLGGPESGSRRARGGTMTTEAATIGGTPATTEAAITRAAEALWVAVQDSPWPTLALVPAEPGLAVGALATAVASVGAAQSGKSIEGLDLRGRPLADSQALVEALAAPQPLHRTVVALDCPLESQAALLFARTAGMAILVVAMERTPSDDAERALELVGRSRFLGAVVQAPAAG
ncbi:MAG: glycosyltransferase family 2 protein [Acidobacteria bacterium]|nr:glycosyltransferase family 2 protein [Acidobacteriota bacterium]